MIGHRYLRSVRRSYKFHDREDRYCLRYANVGRADRSARLRPRRCFESAGSSAQMQLTDPAEIRRLGWCMADTQRGARSSFSLWVAIGLCLVCSCRTQKPKNIYVFPANRNGLFVIVNHGTQGLHFDETAMRREFVFPSNGILVVDISDFSITPQDEFFVERNGVRRSFDPNNEHPDSTKVCAYSSSRNSGYNEAYYRGKFGLPPSKDPVEGMKSFDFYYFNVATDCASDTFYMDPFLEDVYRFLEESEFKSTLPEQ